MNSIKKNYILNLMYEVYALLIPLFVLPYISRVLTPNGVGIYSYSYSIVYYFILIASLGFSTYARREIAKKRDNPEQQRNVFWEVFICKIFTSCLSLICFFIVIFFGFKSSHYYVILMILSFYIVGQAFDITYFYQGLENFKTIILRNFILKTITVVLTFVLVKTSDDLWIYALLQSLLLLFSNISLWVGLPKYIFKKASTKLNFKKYFKPVLILFIPTIATTIYTVLDKTLIGLLIDEVYYDEMGNLIRVADIENGIYEQTEKIVKMMVTILTSLGAIISPRNSYYMETGQTEKVKSMILNASRFVSLLAIPMVFGIIAISNRFCPLYFGPGFEKTSILIIIFSPLIFIIGLSSVFGIQYLTAIGQDIKYIIAVSVGAVLNIVLNLFLIKKFYSYGAAFSTVVAELVILSIMMFLVRKEIPIKKIGKYFIKYLVIGLIMFAVVYPFNYFISNDYLCIGLIFICGFLIYFIGLIITRDEFILSSVRKILDLKKKHQ